MEKKVYITTANGKTFTGYSFGAERETVGELVFTTGMTGYIETLTDPSYYGQLVVQTFPLIGNYGMIESDQESLVPQLNGYIVKEKCDMPSNFRSEGTIADFLLRHNITGVYGVDTRELTKTIRESGVMNAKLSFSPPADLAEIKGYTIKNAVESVTCKKPEIYGEDGNITVILWDFGAKQNIIRSLTARGCKVIKVPAQTSAEEILSYNPDGLMLSNGPGNPESNPEIIKNISFIKGKLPIFGICLGHQLFALACGAATLKMKYGHRGANQPVKNLFTSKVYVTTQNHGYEVVPCSIKEGRLSYVNVNDDTCEGIDYPELNAYTVQFHPEASAGPNDTSFLFDKFIKSAAEFKSIK